MIRKNIPNMLTMGNLFCGCLALLFVFKSNLEAASIAIGIALILDFFDGFVARLLKVSSPIGKDLDSLADMVTFGVVPGFLMYQMLYGAMIKNYPDQTAAVEYVPVFGFLVTVFSGLRLAKFNNDTRQSESFIGLPTPANTIFLASLALQKHLYPETLNWLYTPILLSVLVLVSAYLLIAEIPLLALKFKDFGWKNNAMRYALLIGALLLLLVFKVQGFAFSILLYILLSIVNNIFSKKAV